MKRAMLHSFAISNFFSFRSEGVVDWIVNNNAPDTTDYVEVGKEMRLSKVMAVYGANGSGKTNALKALSFVSWLMTDSYTERPDIRIPVSTFAFVKKGSDEPVTGKVEFSIENSLYVYEFALTKTQFISEKLKRKNLEAERVKPTLLFERDWNEESQEYVYRDNYKLGKDFTADKIQRKNASIISIATRDNHQESMLIGDFWRGVASNTTHSGVVDNVSKSMFRSASVFYKNKLMLTKFNEILQKLDTGMDKLEISERVNDNQSITYSLSGIHKINGQNYTIPFQFESSGSKKLFYLMADILHALEHGGVAILDEFDSYIHPMMSEAIVQMFLSEQHNPHNAQLIFSAHNPNLLNLLDKYQIILTEKNDQEESEMWRLDEMPGVRLSDNYYAKYLAGVYGGVPDIDL